MTFAWDSRKSAQIKAGRGVSFGEIEEAILAGGLVAEIPHPSEVRQALLLVQIADYLWVVVVEPRGAIVRMVTPCPSRKATKQYGRKKP